jgi:hypothetical protein
MESLRSIFIKKACPEKVRGESGDCIFFGSLTSRDRQEGRGEDRDKQSRLEAAPTGWVLLEFKVLGSVFRVQRLKGYKMLIPAIF